MDLLDVDTEMYLTVNQAVSKTGRKRAVILRWVREGRVETRRFPSGVVGLNENQLMDTERETCRRLAENRKVV